MRPFVVNVADLLHRPGARRRLRLSEPFPGLRVGAAEVPPAGEIEVELLFEWVTDGLLATGWVAAAWRAECQRCLRPAEGRVDAPVRELFERDPREGESYALGHDTVDLAPLVREAVLLELPLVPLCAADCAGLCAACGADLNAGRCDCPDPSPDPRWAALEGIRLEGIGFAGTGLSGSGEGEESG